MEEKISSELKLTNVRIDSFRQSLGQLHDFASSVAFLTIQWKDLEDHFSSIHSAVQQHLEELNLIKDSVQEKLEDVERREEELLVLRESADERIREVEAREAEFELIQEKEIQEMKSEFELIEKSRIEVEGLRESIERKSKLLEEKEGKLEVLSDSVNEKARRTSGIEKEVSEAKKEIEIKEKNCAQFCSELKLREEQIEKLSKIAALKNDKCSKWLSELEAKEKEVEERREELALKAAKFEVKEKLIGERCEELEVEKKKFTERCVEVEVKEKLIEKRCEELELEKKKFIEQCGEAELKGKLIEARCEELEVEKKKFAELCGEVEVKEKLIEKKCEELELKNTKFTERCEYVELKEKLIEERCEELELEKKKFTERCGEVEVKEKLIEKRCEELELKNKKFTERCGYVELKEKLIEERCEELEVEKKKFTERCGEVELKEKLTEESRKRLELEKKKLMEQCGKVESKEKLTEERCKKLELEKKKLMERCGEVELKERLTEEKCMKLDLEKKKFMERCREVELKEKLIEERCEELELDRKKFMERCDTLELKAMIIEERSEDLLLEKKKFTEQLETVELKEKRIEERFEELGLEKEKFMERREEVEMDEKLIEERCEELELEKKKLTERCKAVELEEKLIEERYEELELEKKKFMERCKMVELKQKQLEEQWRETEFKEKKPFDHPHKPSTVNNAKEYPADANLHFTVSMDGQALQIFLNEHCQDYDLMRNEILTALGFSSDPAKLVLDAIQGFYPPHLKKGDKEFEEDVIRRSCIMLLEQLSKISTVISPQVKKEAMGLAFDWITKMKTDAEHSLEILGFLRLLASYQLADTFDTDELLTHLEIIAEHSQAPELFDVLGFADKVSGFVQTLIRKKQQVEAIRFIHFFQLFNKFPPVPLLIDFLRDSKIAAKKLRKTNPSVQGQVDAANQRIADLSRAIRCIEECKIEYNSVKNLKQLVECFEKENLKRNASLKREASLKRRAEASRHKIQKSQRRGKKRKPSTVPLMDSRVLASVTASVASHSPAYFPKTTSTFVSDTDNQLQQLSGKKRRRIGELAQKRINTSRGDADQGNLPLKSKDASVAVDLQPKHNCFSVNSKEDLSHLLNTSENHQLEDGNVPSVLQSTRDPGKFCILMEKLRDVSTQLNPELKEQAEEFARHCQTALEKSRDDPIEVICFLQFVAAYKLASIFDSDKLLGLLDTDFWYKESPDLCEVLGLTDKIPIFVQNLIRRGQHLEAVKYIYALNIVDVFPPLPILKNYLTISSSAMQHGDADKEIKALKDVIKCLSDFKITGLSPENLKRRIVELEKQKEKPENPNVGVVQLEKQKEEKPLVIQTSEVKTNFVLPRSKLDQQVSPPSAPITSESVLDTQLQQKSENKCPIVHCSSMDPSKLSTGATTKVHSTEQPVQHSPNMIMNKDVPCMNAPSSCSTKQSLPQNLPGSSISQGNVPSMNLPSRQDTSVQTPLQHPPGSLMGQGHPSMNAPPRLNSSMQPPLQQLPGSSMSQHNPCINAQTRYSTPMQTPLQHTNQGLMQPPMQNLPGSSSQGNPGTYPPPSQYSSMQPPLQFTNQVGPSTSHPPTHNSSAQPSLQHQPYVSQGYPYMNAQPRPYSSVQSIPQYQQGSYMSQGYPYTNAPPWNSNMAADPLNLQLQWNGFAYVPVPK